MILRIADQDSDSLYTTNQKDIVEHAKKCAYEYPTIVNNIPKEKAVYGSSMDDFALMDNTLSKSQTDIGESSNLAQIAQTYACNFDDSKYDDYVCILSVVAQAAIDNSKRRFDIDIANEIKRIKSDMNLKENLYPVFWKGIKIGFNENNINNKLVCPMNYLYNLDLCQFRHSTSTLPMDFFFVKYDLAINIRTCRKVEEMITKYSLQLRQYDLNDGDDYITLRRDFDDLINDIKKIRISRNYIGLFSWLIDRAFMILPGVRRNQDNVLSTTNRNKAILIKTLYDVNSSNLLKCFMKNC